jgi:sulfhydrogenase subunit gamma (sulfur reductase)
MKHELLPIPAVLETVQPMIANNYLFTFLPEIAFDVAPGQFVEISLPGVGGFPASACDLVCSGRISSCIRRTGRVTDALYHLTPGDRIGLRGPFGNGFNLGVFAGNDALLIAGGLGMAPLRALVMALLNDPGRTEKLILLYGSREPQSLLFREELIALSRREGVEVRFSVDFATALPGAVGGVVCRVGLVNELLDDVDFDAALTVAAVCGPPALYGCVLDELAALGLPDNRIFATLERRMRCGIGECCHCVTAGRYVCKDGPVFSLEQLRSMPGAI